MSNEAVKKIQVNLTDEFSRRVWEAVERSAERVNKWPEWKRRGTGVLETASMTEGDE
jgi:hypothetical protein